MKMKNPVVGIGSCLMGQPVRYSGDSKRKNNHIERLKGHIKLNSFCPEMAIGMGVPRQTVRLVGEIGKTRLMDSKTQTEDFTAPMKAYAAVVIDNNPNLSGYILVKGSPSCGYERVKRYNDLGNMSASDEMGMFAAELHRKDPLLPMEEDGRLNDDVLRENFISRVYAYDRWKKFKAGGVSHKGLLDFWARYKYQVMAHRISSYKTIGQLLANANGQTIEIVAEEFISLLMQSLKALATRKSHANVLEHIRGYLKKKLDANDKAELGALITQYRDGIVPLVVPLTLLRHHFKRHQNPYIEKQVFLLPYPEELSLRNRI